MTRRNDKPMGDRSEERSPIGHAPDTHKDDPDPKQHVDGSHEDTANRNDANAGDIDAQAVLAFLESAPPEVKAWLSRQVAAGSDHGTGAEQTDGEGRHASATEEDAATQDVTSPSASPLVQPPASARAESGSGEDSDASTPSGELDDDPDADLLDEGDDDILKRPHKKRPSAATPATNSADKPAPSPSPLRSRAGIFLVAAGLIVGLCFGVWFAGRPSGQAAADATPTMSSDVATENVEARISELTAKIKDSPDDVDAHLELGVLLFNQGELDSARDQWLVASELAPEKPGAWYNLGFYYASIDPPDNDKATAAWQKVIDIDPDSELARNASSHMGMFGSSSPTATPTDAAPSSDAAGQGADTDDPTGILGSGEG